MRTLRDGAHTLHAALRSQGGTVAEVLEEPPALESAVGLDRPGPAQVAAAGPRATGRERDYELLLEMILEGYRLHYSDPLVVRPDDRDLALLLGDQLYALGLSRLGELGDLDAVAELADVISLVAQAHAAADSDLAAAIWEAGAVCVGWGPSYEHHAAKARARARDPQAAAALRAAAVAGPRDDVELKSSASRHSLQTQHLCDHRGELDGHGEPRLCGW
jgi:hypothetical protein